MRENLLNAESCHADKRPDIWAFLAALGKNCSEAGPLTPRERQLVKLACAFVAGTEGAVHSHRRRAYAKDVESEALRHVAFLAIGSVGLPRAVAARTWIGDIELYAEVIRPTATG